MSRDPHSIPPEISQAASEWFIAMRDVAVPDADRAAFSVWLQASPVHVRAYLDVARLWGDAVQLPPDLPVEQDSGRAATNVLPIREAARPHRRAADDGVYAPTASPGRATRRRYAVAACIVLLAGMAGAAWWQLQQPPTYITEVGEQRVITLEDGSIVRLNSRSGIQVRMRPDQRLIDLIDGQALFEVAKDPRRPFTVRSGSVTARAVGTQFDVYRKPTATVVTVVEGQVEVRAGRAARDAGVATIAALAAPVSVMAGEQVIVSRAGAIEQHGDANVNAAPRWLHHELVFDGQPLSAVVEKFNRYQRVPIVLDDPVLGELRINAVFNTTGPEALLRFVSRMDDVQVERGGREIRITRKQ